MYIAYSTKGPVKFYDEWVSGLPGAEDDREDVEEFEYLSSED